MNIIKCRMYTGRVPGLLGPHEGPVRPSWERQGVPYLSGKVWPSVIRGVRGNGGRWFIVGGDCAFYLR